MTWVPYDGVYPLREEGWLMAPDKPGPTLSFTETTPEMPLGERHAIWASGYETGRAEALEKPIDDLEDDAPDVPNDDVTVETKTTISQPSENDDDEKENPNG